MTLFLSALTLLPLSHCESWWVRGLDFPRLQFSVLAIVLFLLELIFLDFSRLASWLVILIAFGCLLYQVWWIFPYTPFSKREVKSTKRRDDQQSFSIMTANVRTENRNAKQLVDLVNQHKPDILVTLESDLWWQNQLKSLEEDYSYTIQCPLDNLYGMHVYSKLRLEESQIEYLVQPDIPSMHSLVYLPSGQAIRIHFLHPEPPSPTENEESTERDVELLIVAKSVADDNQAIVVTGDLNDVAWSKTTRLFRKISGLLDPRIGRGMFNTFHAGFWFLRWPLDHLFHSDHFTLSEIYSLPKFGSDHFALFTRLTYEVRVENNEEERPILDSDDESLAKSKLNEADIDENAVPEPGQS